MAKTFTPSLREFQKDVENYLKYEGKCEKNERGQIVYRGYESAVGHMFQVYMDEGAFAPLVDEFRKWNWEWSYNSYLLDLTPRLNDSGNWSLLEKLWVAVIAKRRTNYNKTRKARAAAPDAVSEDLVTKTRELLLEALSRLRRYSAELQHEDDVAAYLQMIARVERGIKA